MKLITDPRVQEFIDDLEKDDKGRVLHHVDLFIQYGFALPAKYLKKLESNLWELRPGTIRLFLGCIIDTEQWTIVHGFKKKTQKTPEKELKTARLRIKEYQL